MGGRQGPGCTGGVVITNTSDGALVPPLVLHNTRNRYVSPEEKRNIYIVVNI